MAPYFAFLFVLAAIFIIRLLIRKNQWKKPRLPFPVENRIILAQKVAFYNSLDTGEKERFEYRIQEFLLNCRITGVGTTINDTDRLLIASSAIIPVFGFPQWRYSNIYEVLLYPSQFNNRFQVSKADSNIMGMVGSGYMEGKMILSKQALHHGFSNESDKSNTAIHEFVHLIDKLDGTMDGIPSVLIENQYAIPWMDLMNQKIDEIYEKRSDLNPYGGSSYIEFFAVASEYFFEKPRLMAQKHPKLYRLLEEVFNQDMLTKNLRKRVNKIGRNSPCPCNSGEKFKRCCGNVHYN